MELGWGFGRNPGIDLPEQSPGTVPTREWLYYYWKDNAHQGQNWCKYGRANGSYVQQIEYDDCRTGYVWTPGQAVDRRDRPGLRVGHPAAARPRLRRAGQRRHPVQPADRRGAAQPDRPGGRADPPPVAGHLPVAKSTLAYIRQRAGRRDHPGHGGRRVRRVPAEQACSVAGKTGTAAGGGQGQATSVFASFAPCEPPQVRGGHDDPELRLRRRRVGPGGHGRSGTRSTGWKATTRPARRRLPAAAAEQGRPDRRPTAAIAPPAGGRTGAT